MQEEKENGYIIVYLIILGNCSRETFVLFLEVDLIVASNFTWPFPSCLKKIPFLVGTNKQTNQS